MLSVIRSGPAYLFDLKTVTDAARREGLNQDRFLTLKIGALLTRKKLRSTLLCCYTPYNGSFTLTVCAKHAGDLSDLDAWIPGCLEFGRETPLPTRAAPFIFYDGSQIHRVYAVRKQSATGYYVCDCALCDLPYSEREIWVRGEKRAPLFPTPPETGSVEKATPEKTEYALYLRTYKRGEDIIPNFEQGFSVSQSGYYICDMGCLYGLCLAEAEKADYEAIRDRPNQFTDYSVVPTAPSENFAVDGTHLTLQYAICEWIR